MRDLRSGVLEHRRAGLVYHHVYELCSIIVRESERVGLRVGRAGGSARAGGERRRTTHEEGVSAALDAEDVLARRRDANSERAIEQHWRRHERRRGRETDGHVDLERAVER